MALMAKANANNIASGYLTDDDKLGLRALLAEMDAIGARIRQKLGDDAPLTDVAAPSLRDQGSALDILSPEDSAIADPDEKVTAPPPVTEPTPPLTIDNTDGSMELD